MQALVAEREAGAAAGEQPNLDDLRALVRTLTGRGARVQFVKEQLTFTGEDTAMATLAEGTPSCVACSAFSARGRPRYAPRLRASAMPSRWRSRISDRSNSANGKAMLAREYGISRETVYQYLRATT